MEKDKRLYVFINFCLLFYFIFGFINQRLPSHEVFPFFSWDLFSKVPNKINQFDIIIYENHGKKVDPPSSFRYAKGIVNQPDSVTAHYLIQNIGKAHMNKNIGEREKLRRVLDNNFLALPVRYELVRVRYNPLERWKSGKVDTIRIKQFVGGVYDQ